ncbi:MAG: BrnA antitoxin family protein [Thermoanaerobaculia bacterium]
MRKEYEFEEGVRGPVGRISPGKTRITIRLDSDVIAWFKDQVDRAGGGSYQRLINTVLREHIARADEPLEETIRRVLREELQHVG